MSGRASGACVLAEDGCRRGSCYHRLRYAPNCHCYGDQEDEGPIAFFENNVARAQYDGAVEIYEGAEEKDGRVHG
jgi:hypothetical protein